jgi:hypothetical protein
LRTIIIDKIGPMYFDHESAVSQRTPSFKA